MLATRCGIFMRHLRPVLTASQRLCGSHLGAKRHAAISDERKVSRVADMGDVFFRSPDPGFVASSCPRSFLLLKIWSLEFFWDWCLVFGILSAKREKLAGSSAATADEGDAIRDSDSRVWPLPSSRSVEKSSASYKRIETRASAGCAEVQRS